MVQALAPAVGGSELLAGYLIGFAIVFAMFIATIVLLSQAAENAGGAVLFISGAIGIMFVVGVGLWDPWTIIFIGIVLAWLLVSPFRNEA